jgi:hypothetical protein
VATVKEIVSKACHSVPGLAQEEQELVEAQVVLALDQVLRKPWSGLDHFLDFDTLVEEGAPRRS